MEERVVAIINEMSEVLSISQLRELQQVLLKFLCDSEPSREDNTNTQYLQLFLDAKKIEGCSDRTIAYYRSTIDHFISNITEPVRQISTERIRAYLAGYQRRNNCTKVTIDNVRRNISSFSHGLKRRAIFSRAQ